MSASEPEQSYPGARLGLPRTGRGSLASWSVRIAALVLDWFACVVLTGFVFGTPALGAQAPTWQKFVPLTFFFVESAVLSALVGGSFGQLICRITVARLDGRPLGFLRSIPRAALVCLALPALVVDGDRRGLHDLMLGTVVLSRRGEADSSTATSPRG